MKKFALVSSLNRRTYALAKRILFKIDSEKIHEILVNTGEALGKIEFAKKLMKLVFNFENNSLNQKILGIIFKNPVGLAAGFDYDAKLTQILPSLGFGFGTIGSITYSSYEGNKRPRLGRLPKSHSLLVNKGLKNAGAEKISEKLKKLKTEIPLGISVAKTNCSSTVEEKKGIEDYISTLKILEENKLGNFYEINISCPNTFGGEPFTKPKKLSKLLSEIDKLKISKPVFLKMPVDFSEEKTRALCETAKKHKVEGLIFGNLTKNRKNPAFDKKEIAKAAKGNFSGLPTKKNSDKLIKFAYKNYGKRFVIIGCGGIFSAEDAYEKIKLGASLVQMISGMIYEGPGIISEINYKLDKLLKEDGFSNISQAIGKENRL